MDTQSIVQIIVIILLIAASAFFSSAETALTTVNEIQVQLKADEGDKNAVRVLWILERSTKMLSAILIGNNIVNIAASSLTTYVTIRIFGNAYVGAAAGILTLVVLLFGEITPKSIANVRSLKLALIYSGPIKVIMTVLTPVIVIVEWIRRGLLKILRISSEGSEESMTEEELKSLVDVGFKEGAIEDDEFEMISNIFDLDESPVKDIMIPRSDMIFIHADASYEEFKDIYNEYHFTRYPVCRESMDSVIGVINIKDIVFFDESKEFNVRDYLREPHFTFEHKQIDDLLEEMKEASVNIMFVLDEYGSISGMITLEDILEEIVGEIRDEYDKDEKDAIVTLKGGREFLIDGVVDIDEVNEATGLKLQSDEYDSIGGYMIEKLDRLPKSGDVVSLENGTKIAAALVSRNRVEKVHIMLPRK